MEGEAFKTEKKTYDWLKQYQFQKGNPGGPGRPKGKSLKTFVKEMLEAMSDEAKAEFLKKLDPEMIWQMGEGRPKQDNVIEGGDIPLNIIIKNGGNN